VTTFYIASASSWLRHRLNLSHWDIWV